MEASRPPTAEASRATAPGRSPPTSPTTSATPAQFQNASFASSHGSTGIWYKSFGGLTNGSTLTAESILIQSLAAPLDGNYTLTFDAARDVNFLADEWYVALAANTAGGGQQDTIDLLTAPMPAGSFITSGTQFTLSLNSVEAGDTLSVFAVMSGGQDAGTNPQSAFLDNFDLVHTNVPEPGSAALLALGTLALTRRRR
ncbi:PEP-CTERM sorting domain-containing protein [Phycisphaeraceae bacterium D3-23]